MKNFGIITIFVSAILILSGCDFHNSRTVIGTGDVRSMEVQVPEFNGVTVIGSCNVDIRIGEPQFVELSAQQEVLDVMTYKVVGSVLEISFDPDYNVNSTKEISADITIPAISYIAVTGSGDFELSGDKQENLDIHITGAGDVVAYEMEVDNCTINISGTGNCKVWVNHILDVDISGVGMIYVKGDPTITSSISGVGTIHDAEN